MASETESESSENGVLALATALSPLALGAIVLTTMLVYFWLSGTLFPAKAPEGWLSPAESTGVALTLSTTPAFLSAAIRAIYRRTRASLDQLRASKTIDDSALNAVFESNVFSLSRIQNIWATLLGIVLGSFNIPWDRVASAFGEPLMFQALSLALGNLVTWVVVAHTIVRGFLVSNSFRVLGQQHARVDLLRLDALLPFGRVGTFSVLIAAIAVSFSSFQSLDAEIRWVNYRYALAVGIPSGLTLLLLPMVGIRKNVRRAKREALERVNELIAQADRELEPESMRYLGDLLNRRETIEHAREWPLDTTGISRIAIYFIIPPIAWIGGALVEILLDAAIGSGP